MAGTLHGMAETLHCMSAIVGCALCPCCNHSIKRGQHICMGSRPNDGVGMSVAAMLVLMNFLFLAFTSPTPIHSTARLVSQW